MGSCNFIRRRINDTGLMQGTQLLYVKSSTLSHFLWLINKKLNPSKFSY